MYFEENHCSVKRGEIYYIAKSKFYSTDPDNEAGRPAIIVSNNDLNERSDNVEIVFLTTKEKRDMPTHTGVLGKVPSTALCETIYTITKDRIGTYIRTCTESEMAAVNKCITHSLDIPTPTTVNSDVEKNIYKELYTQLLDKITGR